MGFSWFHRDAGQEERTGSYSVVPSARSWRAITFCLALAVYAFWSSPTPDSLGWAEGLVLGLLIVSLCPISPRTYPLAWGLLAYGCSVPFVTGLAAGETISGVLRDLIPFLFWLLPLFFGGLAPQGRSWLMSLICFVGFVFSGRTLESFWALQSPVFDGTPPDLLYLANSPEVLVSALCLLGVGITFFFQSGKNRALGVGLMLLAVVPVLAMGLMAQRASFGYLLAAGIAGFLALFWQKPKRAVVVLAVACCLALGVWTDISGWAEMMGTKTRLVGLNSRLQEWEEVLRLVAQSPGTVLFGFGWGARFENPAVGGLPVAYTHNLVSFLWFKTGLIGTGFVSVYVLDLVRQGIPGLLSRPVFLFALIGPFLIAALLYASFKSLGFGLLLLALFFAGDKNKGRKMKETS